jgi:DNA-binding transcriptional regulator YiaG
MQNTRLKPEEIAELRSVLMMSDAEFAERIGLADRMVVKMLESGKKKAGAIVNRNMLRLISRTAARSPRLKKMLEEIKGRATTR